MTLMLSQCLPEIDASCNFLNMFDAGRNYQNQDFPMQLIIGSFGFTQLYEGYELN
jgi:hypothetical protein